MQKNTHNASILIWSIFLSLILSISFITINEKISKNIKNNQNNINNIKLNSLIENKLKNKDYTNERFETNNEKIIFTQIRKYSGSLKKSEEIKIKFEQTSDISINIIEGGPVLYDLFDNSGNLTSSGIIISNQPLNLSGSIILKNLAGYTVFNINSNNNIKAPNIKYKVIKTIGNKSIIKTRGTIQTN